MVGKAASQYGDRKLSSIPMPRTGCKYTLHLHHTEDLAFNKVWKDQSSLSRNNRPMLGRGLLCS
jgi:hypothetical protein